MVVCETTSGERNGGSEATSLCIAHDVGVVWRVTNNADHFRMIGISGDDDVTALACRAFCKMLHARNKRTGRIDYFRGALLEFVLHLRRHAVRTNDRDRIGVGFFRGIDRRDALRAETFHLLRVVNQWTEGANRPRAFFDHLFDHLDRSFNAETESVFVCQ